MNTELMQLVQLKRTNLIYLSRFSANIFENFKQINCRRRFVVRKWRQNDNLQRSLQITVKKFLECRIQSFRLEKDAALRILITKIYVNIKNGFC